LVVSAPADVGGSCWVVVSMTVSLVSLFLPKNDSNLLEIFVVINGRL
jgi:hypothetical protein